MTEDIIIQYTISKYLPAGLVAAVVDRSVEHQAFTTNFKQNILLKINL